MATTSIATLNMGFHGARYTEFRIASKCDQHLCAHYKWFISTNFVLADMELGTFARQVYFPLIGVSRLKGDNRKRFYKLNVY